MTKPRRSQRGRGRRRSRTRKGQVLRMIAMMMRGTMTGSQSDNHLSILNLARRSGAMTSTTMTAKTTTSRGGRTLAEALLQPKDQAQRTLTLTEMTGNIASEALLEAQTDSMAIHVSSLLMDHHPTSEDHTQEILATQVHHISSVEEEDKDRWVLEPGLTEGDSLKEATQIDKETDQATTLETDLSVWTASAARLWRKMTTQCLPETPEMSEMAAISPSDSTRDEAQSRSPDLSQCPVTVLESILD